ncbi:hypothetical protein BU14_0889s0008 [Porphyra umbilicalis]|uniref:Uncharacterized protein n=1 Tax=Porphyra umbilicalis TaxID=2786 RepID=A0A1X6NNH4_PORUM|nr:hypothetical protein BU14_0889s0008 [Porphyra umbilicalis]|eukprot:OSX70137.1 hypothetical protein BU14_0889s0008 [Porphyra umbilicalis]
MGMWAPPPVAAAPLATLVAGPTWRAPLALAAVVASAAAAAPPPPPPPPTMTATPPTPPTRTTTTMGTGRCGSSCTRPCTTCLPAGGRRRPLRRARRMWASPRRGRGSSPAAPPSSSPASSRRSMRGWRKRCATGGRWRRAPAPAGATRRPRCTRR